MDRKSNFALATGLILVILGAQGLFLHQARWAENYLALGVGVGLLLQFCWLKWGRKRA